MVIVLFAALIFGALAAGAGATSVVVALLLKHKTVIVVIIVLGVHLAISLLYKLHQDIQNFSHKCN